MATYIVQRVLSTIPVMLIIVVIGFLLMELPPGDYATVYIAQLEAQGTATSAEAAQAIREMYGLDRPVYERFVNWIFRFVQGDFGQSFAYRQPVRELIGERLLLTFLLAFMSLIIAWCIALPLGVYAATHQYKVGDHLFTLMAFLGVGVPDFMLALVLLVLGSSLLGFVPIGLFSPQFQEAGWSLAKVGDLLQHIWIPALIVAITDTAGLMRVMRGNLLDVLRLDYIQTARAKGLHERVVVWKHAVRNAIHPLVMSLGLQFPSLVSGAAITSIVLNLPIMGPMYLNAVRSQDIYLGGTMLIMITFMLIIGNLFADILLAWVDPRIRYQ